MDEDTFRTIGVMIDREDIAGKVDFYQEEGGYNMCKAMEDWAEELRQEGIACGISQSVNAFIMDYKEEGRPLKQKSI